MAAFPLAPRCEFARNACVRTSIGRHQIIKLDGTPLAVTSTTALRAAFSRARAIVFWTPFAAAARPPTTVPLSKKPSIHATLAGSCRMQGVRARAR